MGILTKLIGGSVGEMADGVANAIDRFVETPEEKAAANLLLMKTQQEPDKWQTEINKVEAAHRTIFVAGWRPFLGWICGMGIGWHFIGLPFLSFILTALGHGVTASELPVIDSGQLMTLIFGMLGLGATRTYEKQKGLTK